MPRTGRQLAATFQSLCGGSGTTPCRDRAHAETNSDGYCSVKNATIPDRGSTLSTRNVSIAPATAPVIGPTSGITPRPVVAAILTSLPLGLLARDVILL